VGVDGRGQGGLAVGVVHDSTRWPAYQVRANGVAAKGVAKAGVQEAAGC
jgi:hypothetical protein